MDKIKQSAWQIIWLEHPFRYEYLRKRYYQSFYPRYFKRGQKVRGVASDFYKLIGYRQIPCVSDDMYQYELYFLKTYDRGCPNEHPNYAHGKLRPQESVEVSSFLI